MRRRMYFLLPDVSNARKTANDLLLARIEDRYMHFLAKRGTDLGELRKATHMQMSDMVHGAEVGLALGGVCGVLVGLVLYWLQPDGMSMSLPALLPAALGGAAFGVWTGTLVGASVPNSQLKMFAKEIEAGRVLLMVDVPARRMDEIRDLIQRGNPNADHRGFEPTMAFP